MVNFLLTAWVLNGAPAIRRDAPGAAVTPIKTVAIAMGAVAAATLAGCSTSPLPLSVEESLYFDKATGADITGVPPGLRMQAVGYPPPPRIYRGPSPGEP
jgi:hypothetical protein